MDSAQWTWLGGVTGENVVASYGSLGVPGPSVTPGGISSAAASARVDALNHTCISGGFDVSSNRLGVVWCLSLDTLDWVWQSGSNASYAPSVQTPPQHPGARVGHQWVSHPQRQRHFVLGGRGVSLDNVTGRYLDELWAYWKARRAATDRQGTARHLFRRRPFGLVRAASPPS